MDISTIIDISKQLKVLYVEDNEAIRDFTLLVLKEFFNDVVVASDGVEGLEKFQEDKFDLVITDINMPRMDGLKMAQAIREFSNVPIVVITAHSDEHILLEAIRIGITDFLKKPIQYKQLQYVLQRIIEIFKYKIELKNRQRLLQAYEETINKNFLVSKTDKHGKITFVNDMFCEVSGYTREELIGNSHNLVRHPDTPKAIFVDLWDTIKKQKKIWRGVIKNRAKDGSAYYVDTVIMPLLNEDGDIVEFISIRKNITNMIDKAKTIGSMIQESKKPAVIYMKLDNYDSLEELYSDLILIELDDKAAKTIHEYFEEFHIKEVLRFGNGEYCFVLDMASNNLEATTLIEVLQHKQKLIKKHKLKVSDIEYDIEVIISVVYEGIQMFESAKLGIRELIKQNNNFIIANNLASKKQEIAKENLQTIKTIKDAINNNKIIAYFQPIVDNHTKQIVKYESLVRLIKDNKPLSPFFFLDVAKKSKYYNHITKIMFDHVLSTMQHITQDVSINISILDIEDFEIREFIYDSLHRHRSLAHRLVFELLEDENVRDFELVKTFIAHVKDYGVKIAIDDFGSGYSNYKRLFDYQPDILKIDGSLIRDIHKENYAYSIVKSIVTFAKELNIQTVAEFVENEEIYGIVKDLGIDYSQGYYFQAPQELAIKV
ncbi:MAG: EAL domain-containing protein [Epsilonproteobacteria bacterium]|nr:EAL domain-containing protein [Campylobacterota bacterium]